MDSATSASPQVQRQLDRLASLSPGADILGLERITTLLARLGDPQERLPPVFHVAGTNGKGSTCAFLRSAIEAAGFACHVYTSPHLVRFNERIRLAGRLIEDDALAALLAEVLDQAGGIGASFFEITTAAALLAFSRIPADACVIEVGLGGRLDATNVISRPLVTGIAQLGIDHQSFLGDTAEAIAGEKAGIAKRGVPLVTMRYPPPVAARVAAVAGAADAPLLVAGDAWRFEADGERLRYEDSAGRIETPSPMMAGPHQPRNLALAIAMLRHQTRLAIPAEAYRAAAERTTWPARMQRLAPGPLTALLPEGSALWLDGGHNPAAAESVAETIGHIAREHIFPRRARGLQAGAAQPDPGLRREGAVRLILGMLANKDPGGLLAPLANLTISLHAVPVPRHECHTPASLVVVARGLGIAATIATDPAAALSHIAETADPADPPIVLILGSLYLAGEVLAANRQLPE